MFFVVQVVLALTLQATLKKETPTQVFSWTPYFEKHLQTTASGEWNLSITTEIGALFQMSCFFEIF